MSSEGKLTDVDRAVAEERGRCLNWIDFSRYRGEYDLRQIQSWIEGGKLANEVFPDGAYGGD